MINLKMALMTALVIFTAMATPAAAVTATRDEMKATAKWVSEHFGPPAKGEVKLPISFVYGGKPSGDLLGGWRFSQTKKIRRDRTEITQVYTDPKTGLRMRCAIVCYTDFPTVEWVLQFKNIGSRDTPIIEDIQSLDCRWTNNKGEFLLHHARGGFVTPIPYQPFETRLEPNSTERIGSREGRSTESDLSYFNLEMPGGGVIIAVGWPGPWVSNWARDGGGSIHVSAGQELTYFRLHPGEDVRTPSTVAQFWRGGDWIRAQNIWRRWMIAHNMPRPGGKLPQPQLETGSSRVFHEMENATEENQKTFIDRYVEEGIKPEYWWMDAGWYPCDGNWANVGTWEVDTNRFPNGLRAVCGPRPRKGGEDSGLVRAGAGYKRKRSVSEPPGVAAQA